MTRSTQESHDHRRFLVPWALIPLALVACGDGSPKPTQTGGTGSTTPTVVNASFTNPSGDPAVTPAPVGPVSYESAEAVYREGRYPEAKTLFESYVASKPENPWSHYMLGLSAWKGGDLARAESAFDRAVELDSTHVKSYLNSARVLIDLGRSHEALERARGALQLDSTSAEARRMIARAYHSLGQIDSAIDAYRSALVIDARDVWSMNNLGVLYLDQGQPEAALAPLARAVQLRGTAPVFQNNLGIALERSGHPREAKAAFEAALTADSTYSKATVSLARVSALQVDSTSVVDLEELAEVFRLQIGMWRDNAIRVMPDPVTDTVSPPTASPESEDR